MKIHLPTRKQFRTERKYELIIGGIFLLIIALLLIISKAKHSNTQSQTNVKYDFSSPASSQTILSVTPQNVSLTATTASQTQVSYITMDTGSNKINAVQFSLTFDPSFIQIVSVQPDSSFPSIDVLKNHIDNKKGTVFYAIGLAPSKKPVVGVHNVLKIMYTLTPAVTTKQKPIHTYIGFLPDTSVGASGYIINSMKVAYPQHITIH